MTARPKCCAVKGTTLRMASPSRTCRCQSSGCVMVSRLPAAAAAEEVEAAADMEDGWLTERV